MKLISYHTTEGLRPGALVDGRIVDIARAAQGRQLVWGSIRDILAGGRSALADLAEILSAADESAIVGTLGEVRLAAPVPDAGKIICIGLNYKAHADEGGREIPPYPSLLAKWSNSLTGPFDDVAVPPIDDPRTDYEGELAVVIGTRCSAVAASDALDYVAGVSVFNDVTSRRLQFETSQWILGKAVDQFAPMGPALVTLDEIEDIQNLNLSTRVNGTEVQSANTETMIWSVAELIHIISETITLEPGDIIATGTPAGVGFRRTPPLLLQDGDVVEIELDQVGLIRNTISDPRSAATV